MLIERLQRARVDIRALKAYIAKDSPYHSRRLTAICVKSLMTGELYQNRRVS